MALTPLNRRFAGSIGRGLHSVATVLRARAGELLATAGKPRRSNQQRGFLALFVGA